MEGHYLDSFAYSKERLAKQLDYEGFSEEEITYAIECVGY